MTASTILFNKSETITHEFGRQVREKRIELNMTQPELATKANISQRFIRMLENKERPNVSVYTILAISIALDFYEWEFFSISRF